MTDQNNQATNPQKSQSDDFYREVEDVGVTEDQLKVMSAVTQAQIDSAENAEEMVKEMEEVIADERAEDN